MVICVWPKTFCSSVYLCKQKKRMPLSRRASREAHITMREAFMGLERIMIVTDRAQLKDVTLDDVRQAALQIETRLAASGSLRNMRRLAPLFSGLSHYSQAIEVLCNGTPYLPWIWAPIKLVLKISADYIEAFEQIIKVYSKLAEPLVRFKLFQLSFSTNPEIQRTLAVYYSDILKFHGEAYKFVRRNAWQRLFATSWGRFQRRFHNIFADLKAHEELVDKTVSAVDIFEAKEMREKLDDWRQQEMMKLTKEEEERTSTEFHAVLSVLRVDETRQINIFDNLVAEANQHPGSCGWILQQPKIKAWAKSGRDTQSAVLHGCVGSGKSVLAAQIASFLRSSEHSWVAAHFCTYLYPESTDYNSILRSLMVQMIRQDPELIALAYDWLVLKKKPPNCAVIEQLLRLLVEALGTTPSQQRTFHIVFDGLNECNDSTVSSVVKTLDKLVATSSDSGATILKVLLCAQMTPAVAKVVKRKRQISLTDERVHLNKAIQDYTLQRINAIRPTLSQLRITEEDITSLASQITEKADGMFLWAKLVMEFISKNFFYGRDEILEAASKLPRELGKFYGRTLSQIMANFDERSVQRISSVLSWISFAKRPLRSPELLSALTFDTGHEEVSEPVPAYILDRCEPLIQKQADSTYAFLHVSVRDFLQSSDSSLSITAENSKRQHGLATVHCLLSCQQIFAPPYPETQRVGRILRGTHGFHMYATHFWVEYLLGYPELEETRFLESEMFVLSCRLAKGFTGATPSLEEIRGEELNPRLALIRQRHYPLYKMAKRVILEQKKDTLEHVLIKEGQDPNGSPHAVACNLIALKEKHQAMIRTLLNYPTYPGIKFQELEQFKQNFRASAFTCRLWSCPHAVVGFSNMDRLTQHEKDHIKHVCRVPGCQYPAFTSARMLKDHMAKCHANSERREVRDTIRRHSKRAMYSFQRESLSAEVKADDSRISARDYNNLDSQAPEVPADTSLGVSNHLSFPYMREASEPASIWPTQGLTAPRSLPQPTELQSLSHSVDPDADTVRQPDGGLDFDAPPPNNRLEFSLDLSPFEESGFLPFDENEAFLLPPPAQTEGMTPLLIASQPPELQLLAPMSQGPSIDLTASTSPDPWRSLGDFGLAEESFQPNIASAARMQGEDDAIPSNQAATRNSKWEFDSQPGGTCDADVPATYHLSLFS